MTLAQRLWSRVDKNGPVIREELGPCWIWTGAVRENGYGAIWLDGSRVGTVHRVAWTLSNGEVPRHIDVCHRCDNRRCVRPDHLFLGTHTDNARDREAKGRGNHPSGDSHYKTKKQASREGDKAPPSVWWLRLGLDIWNGFGPYLAGERF